MKTFIAFSLLTLSLSSFASTASLIGECRDVGTAKVIAQAEAFGVKVEARDVVDCGVSKNMMASYVWFCAKVPGHEKISILTQKPLFGRCF